MSKKSKLIIITSHAPSIINFRGVLISALVESGFEVLAFAPNYSNSLRNAVKELGATPIDFNVRRAGMNPFLDAVDAFALSRLLRYHAPDVVLSYFIKPAIFGTLAAWMAGVRRRFAMIEGLGFVFTDTGSGFSWKRRALKWCVRLLYRLSLARAEKVIFLNQDDLTEFVDTKVVASESAFLLGGIGVDLDRWRYSKAPVKPVTFLMAARLLREKGVLDFIGAARLIKRLHADTRFILLGDLDMNPGSLTRAEIEGWVREGLIEWPGHVPVIPWLNQSSVFVLPSYYREGVPLSSQEAMAMGRALITTNSPGCRETVIEGVNGFLVPVRDVKELSGAMLKFVLNPELVDVMGVQSRRLAEERFDIHKVNRRLIALIGG